MTPLLPLETLDQIFKYSIGDISEYVDQEDVPEHWQPLVNLIKVSKSWRAAGLRHLYSSIVIVNENLNDSVAIYFPQLLRSLKENQELCKLVKEITIFGLGHFHSIKQESFEELFKLCRSTKELVLSGAVPENPLRLQASICRMKSLRHLVMFISMDSDDPQPKGFFKNEVEMVRFIISMPYLQYVQFEDEMCSDCVPEPKPESEEATEDAKDEGGGEVLLNPTTSAIDPSSTLHLVSLSIMSTDTLTDLSIELLAGLTLPYLQRVDINFYASEHSCASMLQCLNKWSQTLITLNIFIDTLGKDLPMDSVAKFEGAISEITNLRSLGVTNNVASMDYVLSKPKLEEVLFYWEFDDEEMGKLASKLKETVPGSYGRIYAYLPRLRDLRFLWRSERSARYGDDIEPFRKISWAREMFTRIEVFDHPNQEWVQVAIDGNEELYVKRSRRYMMDSDYMF